MTMLLALVATQSRRGVMSFRHTLPITRRVRYNPTDRIVVAPARGVGAARFASTQHQPEDYSSMKVSDLRALLRARGQAVSGIKAQLVARLATAQFDAGRIESKPRNDTKTKTPRNETKTKTPRREDGDRLGDDVEDDLGGLINQLTTVERRDPNKTQMGKKTKEGQEKAGSRDGSQRMPGNLVFAKEQDTDDDDWDDEDVEDDEDDPNKTVGAPRYENQIKESTSPSYRIKDNRDSVTFKEDFQGTRVFVQGLTKDTTWKDLKDHFKIAGDVVFASVSMDKKTGLSKQCGLVQFETPAMAQKAILDMRNHPLNGEPLYVRKDVQESRQGSSGGIGGSNYSKPAYTTALPSEWRRANDKAKDGDGDQWYNLTGEERKEIVSLIEKRDKQRRQKNYKMSDKFRNELKDEFGVHLDDRLKLWWTDTKHGGVPDLVSDVKGDGRWGKQKPWKQIPTDEKNDALVDSTLVMDLLLKRDGARKKKDFNAADKLLARAVSCPSGGLTLRVHDESRTWRIWTERPPPRKNETPAGYEKLTPEEMCLQIVEENEPEKVDEIKQLLKKFPGREWNIMKRLREKYKSSD